MTVVRLRTDDLIYRFQGYWIDLAGWRIPFTLRYATWGALAVTSAFGFAGWWVFTGSLIAAALLGIGTGIAMTSWVMGEVDGDRSLRGVIEIACLEARSRVRAHRVRRADARADRPYRVDLT